MLHTHTCLFNFPASWLTLQSNHSLTSRTLKHILRNLTKPNIYKNQSLISGRKTKPVPKGSFRHFTNLHPHHWPMTHFDSAYNNTQLSQQYTRQSLVRSSFVKVFPSCFTIQFNRKCISLVLQFPKVFCLNLVSN